MKKIVILLLLVLAAMPLASAEYTSSAENTYDIERGDFQVTQMRYEPFPVEPGGYATVWLKVTNKGNQDANDFIFKMTPNFPFRMDGSDTATREFGKILTGDSVLMKFKIRVDENAVEGTHPLYFEYAPTKGGRMIPGSMEIDVQTIDAILAIKSVSSTPEQVKPGEAAEVKVVLENMADSWLQYINLNLRFIQQVSTATSVSFVELPFTPIGSGSEKSFYQLAPGSEKEVTFKLVANPDAESGPYKIPLIVEYFDELGRNYSKTEVLGVIVGSVPKVGVLVESSEIYDEGQPGDIVLRVVNKGLSNIKFLDFELLQSDGYDILSASKLYIGKIDSDDYETAEFKINVNNINGENYVPLKTKLSYMDANNKEFSEDIEVQLLVFNQDELGIKAGSGIGTIVFVLILLIVGYLVYKRWEKKRKAKKKQ